MDKRYPNSTEPPGAAVTEAAERVVYVVARDLLPFERRSDEPSFEFMRLVWRDRRLFLACMALCILLSVAYALFAPQWFLAETVLAPIPQQDDASGLLNQLGNLSSLAGLARMDIGKDKVDVPLAVLQSKDFARSFIEDNNLLRVVLAKYWDGATGRWRTTIDGRTPDIRDAVRIFKRKILTVDEDKKTGLVTVSVEWKDPNTAAMWANQLVKRANDRLREEAISKAQTHIAYLQKALSATSAVAVQQALGQLLENETKNEMVARGNLEFAFRVIDDAHPPEEQDKPKRLVGIVLGILGGGIMGMLAVYLRHVFGMIRTNRFPAPRHSAA